MESAAVHAVDTKFQQVHKTPLGQRSTSHDPRAKSSYPVSVNKVLLGLSHTHSFTPHLCCFGARRAVGKLQQRVYDPESQNHVPPGPLQKMSATPGLSHPVPTADYVTFIRSDSQPFDGISFSHKKE